MGITTTKGGILAVMWSNSVAWHVSFLVPYGPEERAAPGSAALPPASPSAPPGGLNFGGSGDIASRGA
ncbi:Hypothetical protein NTJ_04240 [Nesidiocoris tenuis]|uniref:Uncharacterized protein n=1 Tax=Nesidiocoris tenuis TaxID=355587 RepID=A0ABN7AM70_9HEMI|nr:Hypothetical protein NTJ_04240 [Nesidiocoris tenuis]